MKVNGIEIIRDTREALSALEHEPVIAADLETSGLRPTADKVAVVSLYGEQKDALAILHIRGNFSAELRDFLGRKDKEFIWHNGVSFDVPFLLANGVAATRPKIYDTIVGAGVVITTNRAGQRKSLQAEVNRRLGVYIKKDSDHSAWMDPELSAKQLTYCAEDLLHLPALRREQEQKAKDRNNYSALQMEMDLVPVTATMTHNGLPLSVEALNRSQETQRNYLKTTGVQFSNRFGDVNTQSSVQVRGMLADMGMVIPRRINPKGKIVESTAAKVLEGFLMKDDDGVFVPEISAQRLLVKRMVRDTEMFPENFNFTRALDIVNTINTMLRLREAHKRLGMYNTDWLRQHVIAGRIHAKFWQTGTDTIRYSSSEPNLQAWPVDFREVIGHLEGYSIVSADYSQLEVVVSAWLSQDHTLLRMIENGGDIHRLVGSQIFGVSPENVSDKQRQLSKACSFCLLFGGGAATLVEYALMYGVVITLEESKDIVRLFFKQFKGCAEDRRKAYQMAERATGAVELRLQNGLVRHLVGDKIKGTTILNTRVQGNAAVGMKYALLECKRLGLDMYIGATVHDELVACVPTKWAKDYAVALEAAMIKGMNKVVGCTVRAKATVSPFWAK